MTMARHRQYFFLKTYLFVSYYVSQGESVIEGTEWAISALMTTYMTPVTAYPAMAALLR